MRIHAPPASPSCRLGTNELVVVQGAPRSSHSCNAALAGVLSVSDLHADVADAVYAARGQRSEQNGEELERLELTLAGVEIVHPDLLLPASGLSLVPIADPTLPPCPPPAAKRVTARRRTVWAKTLYPDKLCRTPDSGLRAGAITSTSSLAFWHVRRGREAELEAWVDHCPSRVSERDRVDVSMVSGNQ